MWLYLVEVDEVDLGGAAEVHGQVGREEVEEDEDGEQEADLVADGEAEQVGVGGELLHGPVRIVLTLLINHYDKNK